MRGFYKPRDYKIYILLNELNTDTHLGKILSFWRNEIDMKANLPAVINLKGDSFEISRPGPLTQDHLDHSTPMKPGFNCVS